MTGLQVHRRGLFEREMRGGATESRLRRARPRSEELPWGSLDLSAFSADELLAARRGWTDLALQEYAAAASQANALRLVVRSRAPLDLSAMLAGFPLDELAHTEICARMAQELGGTTPVVYPTEDVFPPPAEGDGSPLLDAARTVAWEFCVAETLSLGLLKFHHRNAAEPLLEAVWRRLAKDEAAHAQFGWTFLKWARDALPRSERAAVAQVALRAVAHVDDLDDKVRREPDDAFCAVGVFGSCGRRAYLLQCRDVLEQRVIPRLRCWA
jgi:hypothetical protein